MTWAPDYATVAELADYARADEAIDADQLALAVTAASRAIDRFTRRQFGQSAADEQRFYSPYPSAYYGAWLVEVDDLMVEPTEVAIDDGTDTFAAFASPVLLPRNAAAEARPWTRIKLDDRTSIPVEGVRVTAQFGWDTVPDTIKQATLLQASRLFARRDSPFGVAGSPDIGSELRLLAKLDPDVQVMVAAYQRRRMRVG